MKKTASIIAVIAALVILLAMVMPSMGCQIELPEDRWVNFHNDLTNTGFSTTGASRSTGRSRAEYRSVAHPSEQIAGNTQTKRNRTTLALPRQERSTAVTVRRLSFG